MATPKEQRDARPHAIVVNAFEQRREREFARAREASAARGEEPPAGEVDAARGSAPDCAPPDAEPDAAPDAVPAA